jgi:hypothetical protein
MVRGGFFMRSFTLALSVGGILMSTAAVAQPLTSQDELFIISSAGVTVVTTDCPGFVAIPRALLELADSLGVDYEKFTKAMYEALKAADHADYDRSVLIPEVTQKMRSAMQEIITGIKHDQASTCKKWSSILLESKLIRKAGN